MPSKRISGGLKFKLDSELEVEVTLSDFKLQLNGQRTDGEIIGNLNDLKFKVKLDDPAYGLELRGVVPFTDYPINFEFELNAAISRGGGRVVDIYRPICSRLHPPVSALPGYHTHPPRVTQLHVLHALQLAILQEPKLFPDSHEVFQHLQNQMWRWKSLASYPG